MTEVLFYHLQHQPLEAVLPTLLEKTLERGWRAAVQVTTEERMSALDDHLWTFTDESFLPHGTDVSPMRRISRSSSPCPARTPTAPRSASCRGRGSAGGRRLLRAMAILFDGNDSRRSPSPATNGVP